MTKKSDNQDSMPLMPPESENELGVSKSPPIPMESEYLEIATQNAARPVDLPKEGTTPKTLTESMDDATDLTDMQFAAAKLFPKNVSANDVMIGRIAPDAFLALLHIMATNEVMISDPRKAIDVNAIIVKNYIRLTVGLDGKGRIDLAELLGAAREAKREENLVKGL